MNDTNNVIAKVWKEGSNMERRVVVQYIKTSAKYEKGLAEDISLIMEELMAKTMNKRLGENGGISNE